MGPQITILTLSLVFSFFPFWSLSFTKKNESRSRVCCPPLGLGHPLCYSRDRGPNLITNRVLQQVLDTSHHPIQGSNLLPHQGPCPISCQVLRLLSFQVPCLLPFQVPRLLPLPKRRLPPQRTPPLMSPPT